MSKIGFLSSLPRKREAVRHFTPSWFTVTMGTGSVALTIAAFPYRFSGQQEIALAVWCLNVLLFILYSSLMLCRLLFFTNTIPKLFEHPTQSMFCGALPMAFSTITNGVIAFWVPRSPAAAADAAHAMFWVNLPLVLSCIVYIPLRMATVHEHSTAGMTALWLLPVVPACVAANTAGVVSQRISPELGISLTYTGTSLLGIGFLLSYQICTSYYQRLIIHSLPAREVIVSSFLPVGPMGMTAWAVMNLALSAAKHLPTFAAQHPELRLGPADVAAVIPAVITIAGALGAFLWGFATWWLLLAICCVSTTLRQGIPFNLGWWGGIFPLGVYTGSTLTLAEVLHSTFFRIVGAACVALHVLLWVVVTALTMRSAWSGQLFHAPCLGPPPGGSSAAVAAQAAQVELKLQQATSVGNTVDLDAAADAATLAAHAGSHDGTARAPKLSADA